MQFMDPYQFLSKHYWCKIFILSVFNVIIWSFKGNFYSEMREKKKSYLLYTRDGERGRRSMRVLVDGIPP